MIVGVTATREALTPEQVETAAVLFRVLTKGLRHRQEGALSGGVEFHHGDCVGGDAALWELACDVGWFTVAHPGLVAERFRAGTESDVVLPAEEPFVRNRSIVRAADLLVAAPLRAIPWHQAEWARGQGGTVYTALHARNEGVQVVEILPTGALRLGGAGYSVV